MPFKKGEVSNPKGRPIGSRQKLSEAFLTDVLENWKKDGKAALALACAESPMQYVKMIADMLPKEATLNVNETLTLKSDTVQALDEWLASVGRDGQSGKVTDTLPN